MILIGIGSNLPSPRHGSPRATCEAALEELARLDIKPVACSRWYRAAPVPMSDQPWFVNGVAAVETTLGPTRLLTLLLGVEASFGRQRTERNAPRVLDLDLLAYDDLVITAEEGRSGPGGARPIVPHPRMHERAFVLRPLAEIAPGWRHPTLGIAVEELLAQIPAGQIIEPLEEDSETA